jgi:hypothetical protein
LIGANCGHKQKSMKPLASFDWAPPAKPNQIVVIFSCNLEKESLKQADTGRVNSTRLHSIFLREQATPRNRVVSSLASSLCRATSLTMLAMGLPSGGGSSSSSVCPWHVECAGSLVTGVRCAAYAGKAVTPETCFRRGLPGSSRETLPR